MNSMPCYRRNLAPARNRSGAIFAATVCAVAGLFLVACGKSATQYIDRGNQLYSSGQYGDAALNYRNAIKKTPGSGEAYYRLGLALLKQNQMGEAYQAFSRATTLSPTNMRAKVELASLALAIYARDPRHPAVLYKQAQSLDTELLAPGGNRVEGLHIKSALALIDNQSGTAVEAMREAVKIAPNSAEMEASLAQALLRD